MNRFIKKGSKDTNTNGYIFLAGAHSIIIKGRKYSAFGILDHPKIVFRLLKRLQQDMIPVSIVKDSFFILFNSLLYFTLSE